MAFLVEHVLPPQAPLRQWVLTLPFELRPRLAYDGRLLGAVCHVLIEQGTNATIAAGMLRPPREAVRKLQSDYVI